VGASIEVRCAWPAAVICQSAASRTTKALLKMSRPGARASRRFVRSVQSRPLDIRATSRRRSASGRNPPGDPAKIFKTVIWKLIGRHPTPDQQSYLVACRSPSSGAAQHSVVRCSDSRSVPELTRSAGIQLNERVSLRRSANAISQSAPDIVAPLSGPCVAKSPGDHAPSGGFVSP
jgi:hypothetical protein